MFRLAVQNRLVLLCWIAQLIRVVDRLVNLRGPVQYQFCFACCDSGPEIIWWLQSLKWSLSSPRDRVVELSLVIQWHSQHQTRICCCIYHV